MPVASLFEDFTGRKPVQMPNENASSDIAHDPEKIEAYELGYKAGWDDAATAQAEDRRKIGAELACNLQELSFTYAEARSKLLEQLEPLLKEMVEHVLPRLAAENFGPILVEDLKDAMAVQADVSMDLVIAPGNRDALDALLPENLDCPLRVLTEDTLGEGQAVIRFGQNERQIDLKEVLDRASDAVGGFFEMSQKVAVNE